MAMNMKTPKMRWPKTASHKIKIKIKNKKNSRRRASGNKAMTSRRRRCGSSPRSSTGSLHVVMVNHLLVNLMLPAHLVAGPVQKDPH